MEVKENVPLTMTVPEAGAKYFGISRKAAYKAVANGSLPVVRLGRTLRVPVAACERMLQDAERKVAAK